MNKDFFDKYDVKADEKQKPQHTKPKVIFVEKKSDYDRKSDEDKYRSKVKELEKLNRKFKNLNDKNDKLHVERNILKSKGNEVLKEIANIENQLSVPQENRIKPENFFKE